MIYGKRLKYTREIKGISQKELSKSLNISPYTMSHYENEQDIIPSRYLDKLSNFLDVSIDYLFEFSDFINVNTNKFEIDKIKVGKRLKDIRKNLSLTQHQLAIILNTTQTVIAGYESGRRLIATPFLYTICKKYHISADYLLGKVDNPKYLK